MTSAGSSRRPGFRCSSIRPMYSGPQQARTARGPRRSNHNGNGRTRRRVPSARTDSFQLLLGTPHAGICAPSISAMQTHQIGLEVAHLASLSQIKVASSPYKEAARFIYFVDTGGTVRALTVTCSFPAAPYSSPPESAIPASARDMTRIKPHAVLDNTDTE